MSPSLELRLVICAAALSLMSNAQAARVTGQPGSRPTETPRAAGPAAPDATLDLIAGQVTAVDLSRHTFTVGGHAISFDPDRLKLFTTQGRPAATSELQPGRQVRFALEPGQGPQRKAVLIYLETPR